MADRSLGTLTLNVVAEVGGYEQGMDRAARAQEKVTRQMERDAKAAERANKSFLSDLQSQADAVGKTRTQLLEMQAAQRGLTQQAAPYIAKLREQEAALLQGGVTARQTAAALRGVPAQFTDIFVSLQGGQAPLTVFLQQGGQLKDMFGGIGPAARALGGYIVGLINPFTVAAAAIAGFVALAVSADRRIRELSDTSIRFNATGRAIDTAGVDALISRLNELPEVTRNVAVGVVNAFAGVRQIGPDILQPLSLLVADFAKATGTEVPDAAKRLAEAFKDPAAGAKSLDEQLNILTADQTLSIQKMVEQGNVAGAQAILLEALTGKVQGLAQQGMTPLSQATDNLSNAWDEFKKTVGDPAPYRVITEGLAASLNGVTRLFKAVNESDWEGAWSKMARTLSPAFPALGMVGASGTGSDIVSITRRPLSKPSASSAGVATPTSPSDPEAGLKLLLAQTSQYKSQAAEASKVRAQVEGIRDALQKLRGEGKQDSASYKELSDRLVGAQEKLKSMTRGGGGGGNGPAYRDDAATRFLATLREQEATLRAQLQGTDKLTASQRELVKFEQQIADLKEKRTLTAEQKSLLASRDSIVAQLQKNVAIENEVKARDEAAKKAEELARKDAAFAERARQRDETLSAALGTRSQGYEQTLGAFGQSDRARHQVEQQKSILREFQRFQSDLVKNTPEHLLGSDEYLQEMVKIKTAQDQALAEFAQFYEDLRRLEGDWQNGANRALSTYVDDVANISSQIEDAFSSAFKGMEDALVEFVTTGKLSFTDLADSIVADITRIIVRQQITGPLASWIQGGMSSGSGAGGWISSLFGSLFGGGRANGGPVQSGRFYEVNERKNELLTQGGKTYLMTGANGRVDNIPSGGGSTININQSFAPGTDRKTIQQAAAESGMAVQRSIARGTA